MYERMFNGIGGKHSGRVRTYLSILITNFHFVTCNTFTGTHI